MYIGAALSNTFYSDIFKVSKKSLNKYDVFDGFVDKDSKYYIVPSKLQNIKIDEFKNSYETYKQFFKNIITILDKSSGNDKLYRDVQRRYQLREIGNIGLGYSQDGKNGSAIGPKLARTLTQSSFELVEAGIKDPEIFQLVGLLEEGIGADRISDITIGILIEDFLNYTQNVASKLNIQTREFSYKAKSYKLPYYQTNFILFCPKSLLTDLPVAFDRDDIGRVCSHNEDLRSNVNQIIADGFTKGGITIFKRNLKKLLLSNPKLASELISTYKNKSTIYDFENDPNGDFIWKEIADITFEHNPLYIKSSEKPIDIVNAICSKFQDLVENNGLWKFFHNTDGSHKNENFSQMLFFSIAQSYCEANNLDLSPEVDSGRGPIDFKISKGHNDKINVEIKLSSNNLLHGYTKQLPIYDKAEKTNKSIFLIMQLYDNHDKKIENVFKYKKDNETLDNKLPNIVVVDATTKKSASKV